MRSGIRKREASGRSSDKEWWRDLIPVPFDTEQLALPFNRAGKVEWHYYPTHPFKDNQGTAKSFKASNRWPNVSRRWPLPMADIRVIEEAVGSDRCDAIKAFLIQRCHLTDPVANELSWEQIVAHCRVYLKPTRNKVTKRTTRDIICRLVKKVPAWIYALVIFLASLLAIFNYLEWLEPVMTYIKEILP